LRGRLVQAIAQAVFEFGVMLTAVNSGVGSADVDEW
jgi:hypothetical protein